MTRLLKPSLLMVGALVLVTVVVRAQAVSRLTDLRGVDELKALFNHDAGKVRLVMLISPT